LIADRPRADKLSRDLPLPIAIFRAKRAPDGQGGTADPGMADRPLNKVGLVEFGE